MGRYGSAAQAAATQQLTEVLAAMGVTEEPFHPRATGVVVWPSVDVAARSRQTRREILEAMPAERRAKRLAEVQLFEPDIDLDAPDLVCVRLPYSLEPLGEALRGMEQWVRDRLSLVPDGYDVIGPWSDYESPMQRLRDMAAVRATENDDAVRAAVRDALEQGMSAVEVGQILGVSRQRVYQLRDGRR